VEANAISFRPKQLEKRLEGKDHARIRHGSGHLPRQNGCVFF
jgi:hypothetical protein